MLRKKLYMAYLFHYKFGKTHYSFILYPGLCIGSCKLMKIFEIPLSITYTNEHVVEWKPEKLYTNCKLKIAMLETCYSCLRCCGLLMIYIYRIDAPRFQELFVNIFQHTSVSIENRNISGEPVFISWMTKPWYFSLIFGALILGAQSR